MFAVRLGEYQRCTVVSILSYYTKQKMILKKKKKLKNNTLQESESFESNEALYMSS